MAEKHPIIKAILKEKKITDFLESRGIEPIRESGNRLSYLCPIHEGDSSPSFIVFTDGEYQTYKCFGCHSGQDIINLLCDLDHMSLKQAIGVLLNGISIVQEDITDSFINETAKIIEGKLKDSKELEIAMLKSGVFCRDYLKKYNDEEEINFFIKIYEVIDRIIRSGDIKDVEAVYEILCDKGIPQRIALYSERKENMILDETRAWKR